MSGLFWSTCYECEYFRLRIVSNLLKPESNLFCWQQTGKTEQKLLKKRLAFQKENIKFSGTRDTEVHSQGLTEVLPSCCVYFAIDGEVSVKRTGFQDWWQYESWTHNLISIVRLSRRERAECSFGWWFCWVSTKFLLWRQLKQDPMELRSVLCLV